MVLFLVIAIVLVYYGVFTWIRKWGLLWLVCCYYTYFSIQFRTVNEKGFGDYADGFMPNEVPEFDDEVQGCLVNDDFTSELGDVAEARFATALGLIDNLDCAAATPAVSTLPNLSRRVLSGAMPSNIAVRSQAVWPGTIIR